MFNGGYLVPANAKKGTLLFNLFRPFDLILVSTGFAVSILTLAIANTSNIIFTIIFLLPGVITGVLVLPIPNYHNVLCVIQSILRFYSERRNYVWKGWCSNEQFSESDKRKSR